MKWTACVALVAGCQGDAPKPTPAEPTTIIQLPKAEVTAAYRADIENLCDAVRRSGADQKPADQRGPVIAMWLGPQMRTTAAHEFLVAIQPLTGEPKALALDNEARRVGLSRCELAAEWR